MSPKLPVVTPSELIATLERAGFFIHHNPRGSHVVLKHPDGRRTTVAMHRRDLKKGTLKSILNDVEMTVEEFIDILRS